MNEGEALDRLTVMVDASTDPAIELGELAYLLADAKRPDAAGNLPTNVTTTPVWVSATSYTVGQVVTASPATGRWWICTQAGISGAAQPVWPPLTGGRTTTCVADGTAVWADAGAAWSPTWDLDSAAVRGWELKMARVATHFTFTTDSQSFQRAQKLDHFERMADRHRRRGHVSVPTA